MPPPGHLTYAQFAALLATLPGVVSAKPYGAVLTNQIVVTMTSGQQFKVVKG